MSFLQVGRYPLRRPRFGRYRRAPNIYVFRWGAWLRGNIMGWDIATLGGWFRSFRNGDRAYMLVLRVLGFYVGMHRIAGENHNWVFWQDAPRERRNSP